MFGNSRRSWLRWCEAHSRCCRLLSYSTEKMKGSLCKPVLLPLLVVVNMQIWLYQELDLAHSLWWESKHTKFLLFFLLWAKERFESCQSCAQDTLYKFWSSAAIVHTHFGEAFLNCDVFQINSVWFFRLPRHSGGWHHHSLNLAYCMNSLSLEV